MQPESPHSNPYQGGTIETVDNSDQELGRIHRHPFGIVILYIEAAIGLATAIGLMYFLLPQFISDTDSKVSTYLAIFSVVSIAFTALLLLVATFVYRLSVLVVTDNNMTQIIQKGIFKRKISQLSMSNVEDVTSQKEGIFPTIFNFGTLKIETAGEQNNFDFIYCPKPDYYAKIVLDAREQYIISDPNKAMRANPRIELPRN